MHENERIKILFGNLIIWSSRIKICESDDKLKSGYIFPVSLTGCPFGAKKGPSQGVNPDKTVPSRVSDFHKCGWHIQSVKKICPPGVPWVLKQLEEKLENGVAWAKIRALLAQTTCFCLFSIRFLLVSYSFLLVSYWFLLVCTDFTRFYWFHYLPNANLNIQ